MYLLGIDLGSRYIKAALCVKDSETDELTLLKTVKLPHKASKQGVIIDLVKAKEAFRAVIEKIELDFDEEIDKYLISISGETISSYTGSSTIPLWKQESEERRVKITKEHVTEALKAAKMTTYNKDNKADLHSIAQEFQIDDQPATQNPEDMSGIKLKSNVYVIQAEKNQKENIADILEDSGIKDYKIIYSPLATSELLIDEDDKETGVIIVSIGDQTTELVVYLNGILRMAKVIPFGSHNITKDLKIILKTDIRDAEKLKKETVNTFTEETNDEKMIQVEGSSSKKNEFSEEYISKVAQARLKEIYEFVMKEIYKGSYQRLIHSPVILTGPGSRIRGADKLFSEMNNSKTVPGKVMGVRSQKQEITEEFFTAAGLVKYAVVNDIFNSDEDNGKEKGFIEKIIQFFKDLV